VYVDETGQDTTSTTTESADDDQLVVEVDTETYEVEENYDFDGDGHNDTAVVETRDGYVAFADTDGDGTADVAVQFDDRGTVLGGAEYDEATGEWAEESPESLPTPKGDGADTSDRPADEGSDRKADSDDRDTEGPDTGSDRETITVDSPDGDFSAGKPEYDSDGDGTKDTAIVTDADGTTYAFTDADGDGSADTAVVIESDGDVTVTKHTGDEEWAVVEEGHLGSDGSYERDLTTSGSDAVWAEAT
jgi:hypothetical protein